MEAIGKKLKGISGFKENEGINETLHQNILKRYYKKEIELIKNKEKDTFSR